MKEFGVKFKGEEFGVFSIKSDRKVSCNTQEFIMLSDKADEYVPFLRCDGLDLPIKYRTLISISRSRDELIECFNGVKDDVVYRSEEKVLKTISFYIEEL